MKAKISSKVMVSYLLILFITFLLTLLLSNLVLDKVLRQNELDKLMEQSDAMVKVMRRERVNENLKRTINYFNILNIDKITDVDIYIFNRRQLVYRSANSLELDELSNLIKSTDSEQYVVHRKQIVGKDNNVTGQLILVTDISDINSIKKNVNKALVIAMLLAMLISLLISFWMQKSITRPLKTLIKDMRQTNIDSNKELTVINTGDEIEELYNVYNNMLTRIKKSSDDRKKFFQNTSHELKSPLMAIQGYAEAIKDKVVTGEEVEESLNIIIDKSQYLKKVVEKTIYLSKLETDIYSFERVVFNEYIDNYINEYNSFVTANSNIEIVIDNQLSKNIYVMLDIEKFNSVFNNILDNALRYANTLIKVELSFINDMICIKIIDDGEGFKNNEYDKIFNRFYKGEKGQSGIGLAIAHSITTHHKGSIKAYNYIRGGAVFEILLPVIYID